MGDNAIELVKNGAIQRYENTVEDVIAQVVKMESLMARVLKVDQHYGTIPGTKKPSLYKPGAEKVNLLFRIGTGDPAITLKELEKGHREITVKMPMVHIPTGTVLCYGIGSCSTMETKYRYRMASLKCPKCGKETIIKGKEDYGGGWLCHLKRGGCGAKFKDDDPIIINQDRGQIENKDIADQYNTVLKMAEKRAYVCGTLKATAASDFFTQDVEDFAQGEEIGPHVGTNIPETSGTPPQSSAESETRKAMEEEVGKFANMIGGDALTAARKQLENMRDMAKSGAITHEVYMEKLKSLRDDLETKAAAKL